MRSALYVGTVRHARRDPARHAFAYPVYMTLIALDELPLLDRSLRLFGWNRRAPTSFHDRDHVDVPGHLVAARLDPGPQARFEVLTNLRVAGYVFNPISLWWCRRRSGDLAAVVAEVSNTFGERLPYVLAREDATRAGSTMRWQTEKRLHVSPFMPMEQTYTWHVSEPDATVTASITVHEAGRPDFHASFTGRRVELTPSSLRAALVRYPLQPQRVSAAIHWQALRLLAKKVPFHHKPPLVPGRGSVRA